MKPIYERRVREAEILETLEEAYMDHFYHAEPSDRCHALEQMELDTPRGYEV